MNGTVNPLYGGNNMNGGASLANQSLDTLQQQNREQQDKIYDAQQQANAKYQSSLARQPSNKLINMTILIEILIKV